MDIFLKEKSGALDIFKKFKIMVEKEFGNMIKCLRTDRGGEFVSTAFNQFCSNQGVKKQLTAAYVLLNKMEFQKERTRL
jgi:hypothetical protein